MMSTGTLDTVGVEICPARVSLLIHLQYAKIIWKHHLFRMDMTAIELIEQLFWVTPGTEIIGKDFKE